VSPRARQPASSRLRYAGALVGTVDPLIACGARSIPKFGSFQSSQKLTRGRSSALPWTIAPTVGS
jgi:hypothetical protein